MLIFAILLLATAVLGAPPAYHHHTDQEAVYKSVTPNFPRTFPHHSTVKTYEPAPVGFHHHQQHQAFAKHNEPVHHEEKHVFPKHQQQVKVEHHVAEVVPVHPQVHKAEPVHHDMIVDNAFVKSAEQKPYYQAVEEPHKAEHVEHVEQVETEERHHKEGHVESENSEAGARIVKQDLEVNPDGSYANVWNSENGINVQEQGSVKHVGNVDVVVSSGEISYFDNEGHQYHLTYVADENGFRVQGDHLPTPPPIPPAIAKGLEFIEAHPFVETTTYTAPNEYPDQAPGNQYQPQEAVNQYQPEKEAVVIEN